MRCMVKNHRHIIRWANVNVNVKEEVHQGNCIKPRIEALMVDFAA